MPWEGARSTSRSSHTTGWCRQLRAGPIHLACSPSRIPTTAAVSGAGLRGARSPALPSRRGRDKRHQLSVFLCFSSARAVYSEHHSCTSQPAPLPAAPVELLSIVLTPGAAGESDAAFWLWKCCPALADLLLLLLETLPRCFL